MRELLTRRGHSPHPKCSTRPSTPPHPPESLLVEWNCFVFTPQFKSISSLHPIALPSTLANLELNLLFRHEGSMSCASLTSHTNVLGVQNLDPKTNRKRLGGWTVGWGCCYKKSVYNTVMCQGLRGGRGRGRGKTRDMCFIEVYIYIKGKKIHTVQTGHYSQEAGPMNGYLLRSRLRVLSNPWPSPQVNRYTLVLLPLALIRHLTHWIQSFQCESCRIRYIPKITRKYLCEVTCPCEAPTRVASFTCNHFCQFLRSFHLCHSSNELKDAIERKCTFPWYYVVFRLIF